MNKALFIYSFISLVSLAIIGGYVYYSLGGFDEVEVYALEGEDRVVAGKEFIGRHNSPLIVQYLNEARSLVIDKGFKGQVMRIVYENDTLPQGQVHYFIGVGSQGEMAEVPPETEVRQFHSNQKLAIFLSMNHWVRPSSSSVNEMMTEMADSLNLALSPHLFEIYYVDNSMSIEAWVEEDQAASSSD